MNKQAYIIRCAPSGINRLDEVINSNQIIIGWSETRDDLFDKNLNRETFKLKLKNIYNSYKDNPYSLGQATGYLWRFIREMNIGDYAIVPTAKAFYIGKIISEPMFFPDKIEDDTAIRRTVTWLNSGQPIKRDFCGSGLISRLKYQGTCVSASDFLDDIENAIENSTKGRIPSYKSQLNEKLKQEVAEFLKSKESYLDDKKFEELVRQLMLGLGANSSIIPPKTRYIKYKDSKADIDVIADFIHLGINIYIQVKKHNNESDDHAVKQLLEAMKIDNPDGTKPIFGWVVTSGTFNSEAEKLANKNSIKVVNGEDLAEMIISVGLETFYDIK